MLIYSSLTFQSIVSRNPFNCSDKTNTPGLNHLVLFVRGGYFLPLPFPICDLVHVQLISLIVSVQMNSCLPEQLLPGNWVTDEENGC